MKFEDLGKKQKSQKKYFWGFIFALRSIFASRFVKINDSSDSRGIAHAHSRNCVLLQKTARGSGGQAAPNVYRATCLGPGRQEICYGSPGGDFAPPAGKGQN